MFRTNVVSIKIFFGLVGENYPIAINVTATFSRETGLVEKNILRTVWQEFQAMLGRLCQQFSNLSSQTHVFDLKDANILALSGRGILTAIHFYQTYMLPLLLPKHFFC